MKAFKKAVALMLCLVMTIGVFAVAGITVDDLASLFTKAEAYTNTTIGRITQKQVVGSTTSMAGMSARDLWYNAYANGYFNGYSEPTNMVIPGLGDSDDYTPQGMTYWVEKNWVLISAYDASGQGRASCVYAIDVASGKFVALFNIYNSNGSVNTSHGGGIAVSEHNFYFADSGSKISYVPLSELNVANGTEKNITLKGSVDFAGEMNSAATSYCCYDDGVLWVGNFYLSSEDSYKQPANASYNSMLFGYKLEGNSSQEEWDYLCGKYQNRIGITTASGTGSSSGSNLTWNAFKNGDSVDITGTITAPTAYVGEYCPTFASLNLTEGKNYVIEFKSNYEDSDLYIFAPNGGGHTNVKKSSQTTKTQLPDGRWHYKMTFTAGLKPTDADSSWPTTQSTNGTYTGTYTMRFDQDAIQAGESRNFAMTDIAVREANTYSNNEYNTDRIHFAGTVGKPTYVVAFPNTYTAKIKNHNQDIDKSYNFDRIQYAMVDNGRIYVSRSWSRKMATGAHISEIDIIDIDLNVPGTTSISINGSTRTDCYLVQSSQINQFHNLSMGEAVCVIDDYLYSFTESAAYNYRKKNWDTNKDSGDGPTNFSSQPVDVVWKIDQYALMGEDRNPISSSAAGVATAARVETYEKVNSLDEINYNDEYMIVYESDVKAANGNKILYALDAFGGYKDGNVPKNSNGTQANTADSLGVIGHPITKYATEGNSLKLNDPVADDNASLHWNLIGADTGAFRIENNDNYYGKYKNFYFGSRLMYMMNSEGTTSKLDHIKIKDNGDGTFSFYYKGDADYYLWCNDGTVEKYMDAYDAIYNNVYAFGGDNPETTDNVESGQAKAYAGQVEQAGTFHSDAFAQHTANNSGNKTGEAINAKYTKFKIYRRDADTSIAGESGLATDLQATLNADGTYTLTLESYSTGQTITRKLTDGKPIDFIFVLDASGSMNTNYDVPYMGISDYPEPFTYDWINPQEGKRGVMVNGTFYPMWNARSKDLDSGWFSAWYKHTLNFYYPAENQNYYWGINSELYPKGSSSEEDMAANYGIKKNTDKSFAGGFFWTDRTGDANRLTAMKQSTLDFIEQIQAHAEKTGLQHRIAIVQYGSTSYLGGRTGEDENFNNTGLYATTTGTTMTNFGTLCTNKTNRTFTGYGNNVSVYENAFYPASHDNLQQIVNGIKVEGDPDTFVEHGYEMAQNILYDQMPEYNKNGDRVGDKIYSGTNADTNALIINITDGMPGYGTGDPDASFCSARGALIKANEMKAKGAEIYTIHMGSDESTGGMSNSEFLKSLSSNRTGGSVTSKYESSSNAYSKGTDVANSYYIQRSFSDKLELDSLFDHLSGSDGSSVLEVETVNLNSGSVMLQSLGDTFMLTNSSTATAKTSQIYYDSLGRIYEEAPTTASYSITKNVSNNTVQLTGFDYSSEYVAPGNDGKKLYLQIDGVLLNPAKASQFGLNLPISNGAKTAIYANSSAVSSGTATQYFPQAYFEVPTFNYVYDYGLSMTNSSLYGTPISFDTVPDKQSPVNTSVNINGDAAIGYNGTTITSNIAPTCNGARVSFALMKKPNNAGYYWAKVNMIPASNVYYEDNYAAVIASNNKDWSTAGTTTGLSQSLSGANDVYGYDAAYANSTSYSGGSSKYVAVDATNKRSDTLTFNFTGTGIDLISACGTNTGMQIVTIKQGNTIKKAYIVDTYYNDATYGTLYQVPIIHFEGGHGTYTVETTATYLSSAGAITHGTVSTNSVDDTNLEIQSAPADSLSIEEILTEIGMEELIGTDVELVWMDDNSILNGGTGVEGSNLATQADGSVSLANYFDGFRVYNPMQDQSAYIASEQDVTYVNLINNLAKTEGGIFSDISNIFAYIEGATFGEANFTNYRNAGPENELYLANGTKGVSFKVNLPEGAKVMLGARAVSGAPKLTVNGNAVAINSATEMYYDITPYLTASNGVATVAITNSGNGLLAVNNMKLVGATTANISTQSLDESIALMSLKPVDVEYTLPENDAVIAYPGSEPNRVVANPDPDLDIDKANDDIVETPDEPVQDDFSEFEAILNKIIEFFKKIFATVASWFTV